jgi:site-specific DNA-methyltransferase (adenine-specific)
VSGHIWIVQTKERHPIRFPDTDGVIFYAPLRRLRELHPCIKSVEEMSFLIKSLTQPGDIVLDPCCGLGSTLIASKKIGRRWIGCDLSAVYSRIAVQRLMLV